MNLSYFDIAWFSKVDGPGNRVVLYTQGCNLACPWCHSPHSQGKASPILFNIKRCIGCNICLEACKKSVHYIEAGMHKLNRENCIKCARCIEACPMSGYDNSAGALILPTKSADVQDVFKLLLPQLDVLKNIGGLTISGGEALLQKEAVLELLKLCWTRGIHTAIESSLSLPKSAYEYVGEYVDCWLIGMRNTTFENKDESINDDMVENVNYIASLNKKVIARLPVIKGFTDSKVQLDRVVKLLKIGKSKDIQILPCNIDMEHYYILSGLNLELEVEKLIPSEAEISDVVRFFNKQGFNADVIV